MSKVAPDFKKTLIRYLENEERTLAESIDDFPYYTSNGHWETLASSGADDWVSGFYPAIFWLGSLVNPKYSEIAQKLTGLVKKRHRGNFNTGFRYQYSHLISYELTQDSSSYKKCLRAARRLLDCYHHRAGLICHLRERRPLITATDLYMNLPLLYWAADNDPLPLAAPYRQCIQTNLDRAASLFLREDGSVRHVLHINRDTGEIISEESPQGIEEGCWARGLAWLYRGLIAGSIYFNESCYRSTARRLVSYHCQNTTKTVPAYDYAAGQNPPEEKLDTTAAAILAGGLLIDGIVFEAQDSFELGQKTVHDIFGYYRRSEDAAGLISGGCYHYPKSKGINSATIWGDYYALEALYMLTVGELPPYCSWLKKQDYPRSSLQERAVPSNQV